MIKGLIIGLLLLAVLVTGCEKIPDELTKSCTDTGGTIGEAFCCKSFNEYNFPINCPAGPIGSCGCSPDNSKLVKTCDCTRPACWDGSKCTTE